MNHMHLCLTDLIDQDLSAYEYYHSLSSKIHAELREREIRTLDELQEHVARIRARESGGNMYV